MPGHPSADDGLALWPDDAGGDRRRESHGPLCEYDHDSDFWFCACAQPEDTTEPPPAPATAA